MGHPLHADAVQHCLAWHKRGYYSDGRLMPARSGKSGESKYGRIWEAVILSVFLNRNNVTRLVENDKCCLYTRNKIQHYLWSTVNVVEYLWERKKRPCYHGCYYHKFRLPLSLLVLIIQSLCVFVCSDICLCLGTCPLIGPLPTVFTYMLLALTFHVKLKRAVSVLMLLMLFCYFKSDLFQHSVFCVSRLLFLLVLWFRNIGWVMPVYCCLPVGLPFRCEESSK